MKLGNKPVVHRSRFYISFPRLKSWAIFNIKGQKVKSFPEQNLGTQDDNNGNYSVIWNEKDDNDKPVASGVYFYQLRSGKINQTRKFMLLK
ncbi:MAG: T9SS type A sorting domain-containing protein [Candidatus Cloacimonetes bacterium]|nr:T9SS type A sorting domain-containing protein [Candidatus Cloacimonadota bacterium]MCF7813993.1 T9SS type A sorting domain-containing protein [Candidatus Cloacimonadota bacterium]MCF7868621.1 T9SS type A sorting domain-containing protein [Candidatus Cloacimonadota bacterium]MCF7882850.1 T9SS type A sorting domain-containing protein [Candidatus Cloacimonadota bacterium]